MGYHIPSVPTKNQFRGVESTANLRDAEERGRSRAHELELVWGLGFGVRDLGFRVWDLGFRITSALQEEVGISTRCSSPTSTTHNPKNMVRTPETCPVSV